MISPGLGSFAFLMALPAAAIFPIRSTLGAPDFLGTQRNVMDHERRMPQNVTCPSLPSLACYIVPLLWLQIPILRSEVHLLVIFVVSVVLECVEVIIGDDAHVSRVPGAGRSEHGRS